MINLAISAVMIVVVYAILSRSEKKIAVEPQIHYTPAMYVPLVVNLRTTAEEIYQDSIWGTR